MEICGAVGLRALGCRMGPFGRVLGLEMVEGLENWVWVVLS